MPRLEFCCSSLIVFLVHILLAGSLFKGGLFKFGGVVRGLRGVPGGFGVRRVAVSVHAVLVCLGRASEVFLSN